MAEKIKVDAFGIELLLFAISASLIWISINLNNLVKALEALPK